MNTETLTLRDLDVAETYDLRRRVMRDGTPDARVELDVDRLPGAWHAGALRGDTVVATASFYPLRCPLLAEESHAWQLRMMAVDPGERGRGTGRRLLEGAMQRLHDQGVRLLWCNARDTAIGFYESCGFRVIGEGFIQPESGLPHHVMARDL